ncbi:hypothetical protein GIB67_039290 [Kingdonia uniflora]|uniref:Ionotropic glutamate receptor C-terminal domain-containing protein n=1 Tax=Kingdonia uniflora TaxID=39325 RepID=A0A7J7MM19_9MAGN|nr:hypothetical protein GIB67_039290 [Kingdonia uniflora]
MADQKVIGVGVFTNCSSRIGKIEKLAIRMAIDDYHDKHGTSKPVLHFRDSGMSPIHTTLAAKELINEQKVGAILGLRTWDETANVAELMNEKAQVPLLSFVDEFPPWSSKRWPFLVHTTHSQHKQMRAIAAIVQTWQWQTVNFIYEDVNSAATGTVISHLIHSLQEVHCEIEHLLPLPPFASLVSEELQTLTNAQSRVFIVHTSLSLAKTLFKKAKAMGMMTKGNVWITTHIITAQLDSLTPSDLSSMQGILGVKSYFPDHGEAFKDFRFRFRRRFHSEHPHEANLEPGMFGQQAYDATWALALAMEGKTIQMGSVDYLSGRRLLDRILQSNFKGLVGKFRFHAGELSPAHVFRVINVVRKRYREVGFWSEGSGFSTSIKKESEYNASMKILGQGFWPEGPLSSPRGWTLPMNESRLKIGVPAHSTFNQFVDVKYNGGEVSVTGFAIDVFKAIVEKIPYQLWYDFIPHEGTYDSLVEQIYLKKFDAVVGDTAIVARRCDYAEFSQPWTDSGLQIVVLRNSRTSNSKAWLFTNPFTKATWGLTAAINIYNGFVVWYIERKHNLDFRGSIWNQVGVLIWLAFTTLFSLHGDRLHNNLSRITMVVWLFVAIVIIQTYTANLTSMLTAPRIRSNVISLEYLRNTNAKVGCDEGAFVVKYLEDVLGFNKENIIRIASFNDYPQAFKSGKIEAAFLEVPYVNVLMAKYCKDFGTIGQTYKVGGFGFVFPRGSPMLPDISKAVLQVTESGKLRELENALINSYECSKSDDDDGGSLGLASFWALFAITVGTSTAAFIIYVILQRLSENDSTQERPVSDNMHDPYIDEIFMFAPEINPCGNGLDLTPLSTEVRRQTSTRWIFSLSLVGESQPSLHRSGTRAVLDLRVVSFKSKDTLANNVARISDNVDKLEGFVEALGSIAVKSDDLNNPFAKLDVETVVHEKGEIDIQNDVEDTSMLTNPHHAVEEFSGVTDRRQPREHVTATMVRNPRRLPALYGLVDAPIKSESSFEKGMIPTIEDEAESPKKVVPAVALFGKEKGCPWIPFNPHEVAPNPTRLCQAQTRVADSKSKPKPLFKPPDLSNQRLNWNLGEHVVQHAKPLQQFNLEASRASASITILTVATNYRATQQ